MEYLQDYDFALIYHPGKANVVTDALSRKNTIVAISLREWEFVEVINSFGLQLQQQDDRLYLSFSSVQPMLIQKVLDAQNGDAMFDEIEEESNQTRGGDSEVRFKGRLVMPNDKELRGEILCKAYHSRFFIHPKGNKMYRDFRHQF